MSFRSAWLMRETLVLHPLPLLRGCPSIKTADKPSEIRLAAKQMGAISTPAALEVMAPDMLFPYSSSWDKGFIHKWPSWPSFSLATSPPSALPYSPIPFSLSPLPLAAGKLPAAPSPHPLPSPPCTTHKMWVVCFPTPCPPPCLSNDGWAAKQTL